MGFVPLAVAFHLRRRYSLTSFWMHPEAHKTPLWNYSLWTEVPPKFPGPFFRELHHVLPHRRDVCPPSKKYNFLTASLPISIAFFGKMLASRDDRISHYPSFGSHSVNVSFFSRRVIFSGFLIVAVFFPSDSTSSRFVDLLRISLPHWKTSSPMPFFGSPFPPNVFFDTGASPSLCFFAARPGLSLPQSTRFFFHGVESHEVFWGDSIFLWRSLLAPLSCYVRPRLSSDRGLRQSRSADQKSRIWMTLFPFRKDPSNNFVDSSLQLVFFF